MTAELIKLSHESTNAFAFEAGVLDLLQREVGFDVGYFSVKGDETCPTVVGLDQATVELAVAHGETYVRELLPVKQAALAARGVGVDTDVLGFRRMREMSYYREIAVTVGGRHSLLAYIPWRGETVAMIMLGRSGGAFSNRDISLVESLLPGLGATRAAFGLPWMPDPLPGATKPGLLSKLGPGRRTRRLASVPTPAGMLLVQDREGFREMIASQGESALVWTRANIASPGESGWPYVDLFHLAAAIAKRRRRALFIGCGGAVALRQFASVYTGISLDVVEREPAVIELARSWYDLDAIPGLAVHVADGIDFISQAAPACWDVVIIDAFDAADLAAAFTRRSFFAALRRVLCPGGAMALNLISTLDRYGPLRDVVRSARAELDNLRVVPVMTPDEDYAPNALRNIVVVATR